MILALSSDDLWRDPGYRRLWLSLFISSFGGQVSNVALSLTSAISLHATPAQMGLLGTLWLAPFVIFLLPSGVWLDRVRKLPVYIGGEVILALTLASVTLVWFLGHLSMGYLYGVAFVSGCVSVFSGTAAQILLTQIVPRERLVEAHARNALATSSAEIIGPGAAGMLIKLVGAPFALMANSLFLLCSIFFLRGIRLQDEPLNKVNPHFFLALKEGIYFVATHSLLRSLTLIVGCWQLCQTMSMVAQVIFATRTLELSAYQYGLCLSVAGGGTVIASTIGHRVSRRIGPGPCFIAGIAISGLGWLQQAFAPVEPWGIVSFEVMLLCFSAGTVLIFSNTLALRQSFTPAPMLARMTSTMRFISLLLASFGTLIGGLLGEYAGLHFAIGLGGFGAVALAMYVWFYSPVRHVVEIPRLDSAAQ